MPVSPANLVDIINKNKSKKIAANKLIETNPKILPIIPKLIRSKELTSKMDNESDYYNINRSILEEIYNNVKSSSNNNKNIIKLFPDIELSIQILVSSILSPKKMTDIQLNYKLNKNFNITPNVSVEILENIKNYINDNYELEDKLSDIVREALFDTGAFVYAVIPESSVDEVINTDIIANYSTEEFKVRVDNLIDRLTNPINIIKSNNIENVSLENKISPSNFVKHLVSSSNVKITDNVSILKFSSIKEKINSSIIRNSIRSNISIAQESINKVSYIDIFRNKEANTSNKNIEFLKKKTDTRRKSIGKPMLTKLPTESVIPIFIPGNEKEHIGYFVLLDEVGKPLTGSSQDSCMNKLNGMYNMPTTNTNTPVQKAYNNLISNTTDKVNVNELFEMYKEVLEKQLFTTIKSSLYGSNVDISQKNDIYFLMFTRALAEQKTNILYIPKELIVYFAFQYNEIGVGKSLLENLNVLSSMRAIILFAKIMAYAKQSIDVTKVNISLDPNDTDPEKTIEQIQDSVLKLRQNFFPLGINNPVDLINWIQRAGLQFNYENNPLLPDVKINFENSNIGHTIPSPELEEDLRKQTILALGLSPETVDSGFSPEFATTVVNNNILLSKRVLVYQKKLIKHLTKFISILIYNDEDLRNEIKNNLTEHLKNLDEILDEEEKQLKNKDEEKFIEYYIDKISENILIDLPRPENTNLSNLSAEYDVYKENLEKVIDSVLSQEIFSQDISGDISNNIENIRNIYKHYLLRKWMAANDFYPESLEISDITNEKEMNNMLSIISEHITNTMKNSTNLVKIIQKFKLAANTDLGNNTGSDSIITSNNSTNESDINTNDTDINF